jgi:RNA polymerase sigma-70 factor (ECF subfamily)
LNSTSEGGQVSLDATNDMSDAAVIARVLRGDDSAFGELVVRYQGMVFGCTRAITRNHADAADAAQEAFIRLYRHMEQFDPRRPLKPYLLRIATNCAHNAVARRPRTAPQLEDGADPALDSVPDAGPGPEQSMAIRERRVAVRSVVEALPGRLREVCALFYLADCACAEVAQILHMSETAVKVALHRAREKLKQGVALAEWQIPP